MDTIKFAQFLNGMVYGAEVEWFCRDIKGATGSPVAIELEPSRDWSRERVVYDIHGARYVIDTATRGVANDAVSELILASQPLF